MPTAEELKKEIAEGPKPTGQEEGEDAQEEATAEEPVAAGSRGQVAVQEQLLVLDQVGAGCGMRR